MEAFQLCPWDSPAFPTLFFEPTRVICRIFPQSHFPVFYLSATLSAPSSVEISLRFTRFFNGKFPAVAFRPLVNSPRRFHPGCPVRTFWKVPAPLDVSLPPSGSSHRFPAYRLLPAPRSRSILSSQDFLSVLSCYVCIIHGLFWFVNRFFEKN